MLFWDKGFDKTPEERVGALVWRMHRSARMIFTMNFHLGNWTPQQCVQSLIDNVGFEPENAAAEVRRSFDGSVGPLYQSAYLMGALQFRALHKELVDSKKMTDREFQTRFCMRTPCRSSCCGQTWRGRSSLAISRPAGSFMAIIRLTLRG